MSRRYWQRHYLIEEFRDNFPPTETNQLAPLPEEAKKIASSYLERADFPHDIPLQTKNSSAQTLIGALAALEALRIHAEMPAIDWVARLRKEIGLFDDSE